jgi:hypothetical protein
MTHIEIIYINFFMLAFSKIANSGLILRRTRTANGSSSKHSTNRRTAAPSASSTLLNIDFLSRHYPANAQQDFTGLDRDQSYSCHHCSHCESIRRSGARI